MYISMINNVNEELEKIDKQKNINEIYPVLVELMEHTPNPERVIAYAHAICYNKHVDPNFGNNDSDFKRRIRSCIKANHTTPLEHVSFTFLVTNASKVISHQLVRHRTGSFNQLSNRYAPIEGFYIPNVLCTTMPEEIKEYVRCLRNIYLKASDDIKKEMLRYVAPQGTMTSLVVTFDGNNLRKMLKLRLQPAAQPEIRILAEQIRELVYSVCPTLVEDLY